MTTSHGKDLAPFALSLSKGKVWLLGSEIDTDVLAPGAYMQHGIEVIAQHCLESVRPEFAAKVQRGDVIVAGENFGIGSSREQAAGVLVHVGIRAVIAPSYSGLYFRNAFNLGLLLITCKQAALLTDDSSIDIQWEGDQPILRQGKLNLVCEAIPDFLREMVAAGGLLHQLKKRFQKLAS
jgi:3-isopropylmalate/(R)-2-methylmalate dehydratase small subunit